MKRELLDLRLARRDFLKVSSAAAVTPALLPINGAKSANAAATSGATDEQHPQGNVAQSAALAYRLGATGGLGSRFTGTVTVGYYDGSPGGRFVDARSLAPGDDLSTVEGASVQVIDGELDGQTDLDNVRSLSLSFDLQPVQEGLLHVWYRQLAPIPHSSATMSVWLPLDTEGRLAGWLDVRTKEQQGTLERIPVTFGPGGSRDVNGLRSGYYAIAVTSGREITWDSVALHGSCGGNTLCLTDGGSALTDVPWVLLSVALTHA